MDIYTKNQISSFKENLPETLQVDPKHLEVALIEFSLLIYGKIWERTKIGWTKMLLVGTILS